MKSIDGPTAELWRDLRRSPPAFQGEFEAHELRVDGIRCGLFMAIGSDLSLHLFIPITNNTPDPELPVKLNGLEVNERRVMLADASAGLYLDVCSTPTYETMFTTVASEIAQAVAVDCVEPRKASLRIIRRWQAFWRPPHRASLTRAEQLGLFGEVWWLNRVLIPKLGPRAVRWWTGPNKERHDFQGSGLHIEVKVTERSQPIFRISGLDQLTPAPSKQLAVATLMVREEAGAAHGLVREIAACEEQLSADVAELEMFRNKLAESGYRRDSEAEWDKFRLQIRAADLYEVTDTFPRLTEHSFEDGCPRGVSSVSYDIDLATVPPLSEAGRNAILSGLPS